MRIVLLVSVLLIGCGTQGRDVLGEKMEPLPVVERIETKVSLFFCSTESLTDRFKGSIEKGSQPPKGSIAIFDARKSSDGHAAVFRANRVDAASVIECFDDWESHAPEVVYKSTGKYPIYFQHVIRGGCERGELNCAD